MRAPRRTLACALAALLAGCGSPGTRSVTFSTASGQVRLQAAVADEPHERARGLMGRASLPSDEGLLFLWPDVGERTFTMAGTLIPLDVIVVRNGVVVQILTLEPCEDSDWASCLRSVTVPADMVVEANAGAAADSGIEVGSRARVGS